MNEEISRILNKLRMPRDFYDILVQDLYRIAADERMPFLKGITLYSSSTETTVYIQRILDIMRKENSDWRKIIETSENVDLISFTQPDIDEERLENIKEQKGTYFIDLDSFDSENEKRKCVQRFSDTGKSNMEIAANVESEIRRLEDEKKPTFILENELDSYDQMIKQFENDIARMENSRLSIFYGKKLQLARSNLDYCIARYNEDVNAINSADRHNKQIDMLCTPRIQRYNRILNNTKAVNARRTELERKFFGEVQREGQEK